MQQLHFRHNLESGILWRNPKVLLKKPIKSCKKKDAKVYGVLRIAIAKFKSIQFNTYWSYVLVNQIGFKIMVIFQG